MKFRFERKTSDKWSNDPMMAAVEHRIHRMLRPSKFIMGLLAVVTVIIMAACAILGYTVVQARQTAVDLKNDVVSQCQVVNDQRAQLHRLLMRQAEAQAGITATAFAIFISIAEGRHPTARVIRIGRTLEALIVAANNRSLTTFRQELDVATKAHNCTVAYGNVRGGGGGPHAGAHLVHLMAALSFEVVALQSWNGYCLSAAGAQAIEVPCGNAHPLWYNPVTGQLTLSGHSDVSFADSGGRMVLRHGVTAVLTNNARQGPHGYLYDRMWFGKRGTYWHANGNRRPVTFTARDSNADYWAWLSNGSARGRAAAA